MAHRPKGTPAAPHLRVVDTPEDSWQRMTEEPGDAYAAFLLWLMAERPRDRPRPERDAETPKQERAAKLWPEVWDWHRRAEQYDAHRETPKGTPGQLVGAISNMSQVLYLEARKLLDEARRPGGATLTPRELIGLLGVFVQGKQQGLKLFDDIEDVDELDFDNLTDDEFRALRQIWKKVRK